MALDFYRLPPHFKVLSFQLSQLFKIGLIYWGPVVDQPNKNRWVWTQMWGHVELCYAVLIWSDDVVASAGVDIFKGLETDILGPVALNAIVYYHWMNLFCFTIGLISLHWISFYIEITSSDRSGRHL